MGLVFELTPELADWLSGRIMGLSTKSRFFKTYRRHAIVILLILAAFYHTIERPIYFGLSYSFPYMHYMN